MILKNPKKTVENFFILLLAILDQHHTLPLWLLNVWVPLQLYMFLKFCLQQCFYIFVALHQTHLPTCWKSVLFLHFFYFTNRKFLKIWKLLFILGHHQLKCCSLSFFSVYVRMRHVIIDFMLIFYILCRYEAVNR